MVNVATLKTIYFHLYLLLIQLLTSPLFPDFTDEKIEAWEDYHLPQATWVGSSLVHPPSLTMVPETLVSGTGHGAREMESRDIFFSRTQRQLKPQEFSSSAS